MNIIGTDLFLCDIATTQMIKYTECNCTIFEMRGHILRHSMKINLYHNFYTKLIFSQFYIDLYSIKFEGFCKIANRLSP